MGNKRTGCLKAFVFTLLGLVCPLSVAGLKVLNDGLDDLYNTVQQTILPGISITLPDEGDGSDAGLIDAAICSYLNWAVSRNAHLMAHADTADNQLHRLSEQHLPLPARSSCEAFFQRHDRPVYNHSEITGGFATRFPVEIFWDIASSCFSSRGSYVQGVPSYCEWQVDNPDADTRERIVMELILLYLGQVLTRFESGVWEDHYRALVNTATRVETQSVDEGAVASSGEEKSPEEKRAEALRTYALGEFNQKPVPQNDNVYTSSIVAYASSASGNKCDNACGKESDDTAGFMMSCVLALAFLGVEINMIWRVCRASFQQF